MNGYDVIIGLEVHAQLLTASKIFCGCSTKTGAPPNTNTCPVCMGMPGTLPVLNSRVVDFGIRLSLALGSTIIGRPFFARKNYFYPDLPKGYQISQHTAPLSEGGHLDIEVDGINKSIRIMRIHMEEDAGKTIHGDRKHVSHVDYNRSGVPLLEIVSMPDIRSSEEASAYLRELRQLLMYLGICDGNMEEGSFRCDANVSVKKAGSGQLGKRTEIKNMNSFRNVRKALDFEIKRHIGVIESGGSVEQETRLWDASGNVTVSMRSKEESHDYRYFPEPDLMPLAVEDAWIEAAREKLPELPGEMRARFRENYGIPAYDASVLTQTRELALYFEECVKLGAGPKEAANWIMTGVLRVLNEKGVPITSFGISPSMLAGMIGLVEKGEISGHMAKEVFEKMLASGKDAPDIVKARGMSQMSDEEALKQLASRIIGANPDEAGKYRAGKTGLLGFFVGKVMSETKGSANPKLASRVVKELLEK